MDTYICWGQRGYIMQRYNECFSIHTFIIIIIGYESFTLKHSLNFMHPFIVFLLRPALRMSWLKQNLSRGAVWETTTKKEEWMLNFSLCGWLKYISWLKKGCSICDCWVTKCTLTKFLPQFHEVIICHSLGVLSWPSSFTGIRPLHSQIPKSE